MSRTEAVHTLNLEAEKERLDNLGIVHAIRCQQDLEEAASAYKNIEKVIAEEQDLVKVKVHLSPIAVIKG
jgi:tRNA-splicing ligase RtcB